MSAKFNLFSKEISQTWTWGMRLLKKSNLDMNWGGHECKEYGIYYSSLFFFCLEHNFDVIY